MDVLAHLPHIVGHMLAAGVGFLAGVGVEVFETFKVLGTVVGAHIETLDSFPHEFLLVVGTLEVLVDHLLPFLGRNRWKFAKQLIVFHYLVSFMFAC